MTEEDDETTPAKGSARSQAMQLEGLDEQLAAQLPTFEQFFKTFGFKRVHGRIWGLLVLIGRPLSAKDVQAGLSLSQGATSIALKELEEWGAITTEFDSQRRCHLHAPVSNTLSIAATVIRRREQVAFQQFKAASTRTLAYVTERYGDKDPRVMTLRSIVSTCEIAEAVIQLVVGSVANALDDSGSLLHRAVATALKVGFAMPTKLLVPMANAKAAKDVERASTKRAKKTNLVSAGANGNGAHGNGSGGNRKERRG